MSYERDLPDREWVDAIRDDPDRARQLRNVLIAGDFASPVKATTIAGWLSIGAPKDLTDGTLAEYRKILRAIGPPAPTKTPRKVTSSSPNASAGKRASRPRRPTKFAVGASVSEQPPIIPEQDPVRAADELSARRRRRENMPDPEKRVA